MKLVLLLSLLLYVLSSFLSGKDITSQAPRSSLTPNVDEEEDEKQLNVSLQESQRFESEFGFPWLQVYLPIKSCHVILKNETGAFSPPILNRSQANNWCNWTIWAGPHKHILIYIEGFEGKSNCEENQDKIIFQGVLSSVESKVAYACRNQGTLIFATHAVAVHVVFLSNSPQNHSNKYFKGWYYIFEEHEMKEPVSKSNSNAGFSRKSYIVRSAHVLDFVRTSRTPSSETWFPLTTKKSWKRNDRAETLDALHRPAVGNSTQVSFLKSAENVTLNPFTIERMQVANSTVHETRPGNESSSGNLRENLDLRSNRSENEEKQFAYNQTLPSASAHVSQKLKMMTKLVELNDHETTTKSTSLQNGNHVTTQLMATYTEDAVEATFGKVTFKNRITLPQVLVEEPTILSPKNIVEKRHSQSFQSNSGFSRKNTDVVESQQHMRPKEALTKEQIDNQAYKQENSNSKRYMVVPLVRNNKSQLITETPQSSINKRKSQVTTIDHSNVLRGLSLRALKHNFMDVAATVNPQIVYSRDPKKVKVEMTVSPHLSNSVTRYRKQPQRKYTIPNPPYSPSGSASRSNTSLKVENDSYESVFRSGENDSVLLSQHNPGDLLFEITFGIEHKGQTLPTRSGQDKAFIELLKRLVQSKVKPFSNKVKEIKLKETLREESVIDRQTDPELMVMFWLHLTPKRKDVAHLVHSQLENLNGTSVEVGKIQRVLVRDVNECDAGVRLCGDEATCLNGYGTYLCKCKEDYEDRSQTKSGTMCIRSPRSGLDSLYSYAEILVGTTVFFISALVVVISVLCTIVKKRRTKKDLHFQEAASAGTPEASGPHQTTFDQNNIHHLLTLDPAQLKLRAKVPERPLQVRNVSSEAYRVSIEQSEYL